MATPPDMEVELDGLFKKNETDDYYEDYVYMEPDCQSKAASDALGIFIPLLYSLGIIWGLLGNGLLLAVFWQKRKNFSVMDIFIFHLSLIDVLLLLTLPLWAVDAVKGWIMGTGLCKLAGALFKINFYCGIFTLAFISVNYYLSIVCGVQKLSRKKPMLVHSCCLIIWLFSSLLSIPDIVHLNQTKDECIYDMCPFSRFLHHGSFVLATLVLLFCCSSILCKIWGDSVCQQRKMDRRTALISVLVLVFLICWTPYSITFMVNTARSVLSKGTSTCEVRQWTAIKITAISGLLHCAVNPVIYFCFSKEFRRRALSMIKFTACETNNNDGSLWESDAVNDNVAVQEEQGPLQPVNELKQIVETQNQDA